MKTHFLYAECGDPITVHAFIEKKTTTKRNPAYRLTDEKRAFFSINSPLLKRLTLWGKSLCLTKTIS